MPEGPTAETRHQPFFGEGIAASLQCDEQSRESAKSKRRARPPFQQKGLDFSLSNDLGVFRSNRHRAIHRWYPFIEGYSEELVSQALAMRRCRGAIFDPFAGSGTTPLAVAFMGGDSYYSEVNPYLSWVTDVKVNQASLAFGHPSTEGLREFREAVSWIDGAGVRLDHPLVAADNKRGFFPAGVAAEVVALVDWVSDELTGPARELARLAVATSLIPCSNMVRRTDLRRRSPGDQPPSDLRQTVVSQLDMILTDIGSAGWTLGGHAYKVAGDVRQLPDLLEPLGLIITSPPYLNGTNYCRNTKLELLALGFMDSEAALADLRTASITAGINNVSSRRSQPVPIGSVEPYAEALDTRAYDSRIPSLVRGYFSDMKTAFERMRLNAVTGAKFFLDIGDSKFAGVHVPTPELLTGIAADCGWHCINTVVLRARKSYDGTILQQVLIELEAV